MRAASLAIVLGAMAAGVATVSLLIGFWIALASIVVIGAAVAQSWKRYRLPSRRLAKQMALGCNAILLVVFYLLVRGLPATAHAWAAVLEGGSAAVVVKWVALGALFVALALLASAPVDALLGRFCAACGNWTETVRWTVGFDGDQAELKTRLLGRDFQFLRELRRNAFPTSYRFILMFCRCPALRILDVIYHDDAGEGSSVNVISSWSLTAREADLLKCYLGDVSSRDPA
jgi:hypothetical protein